MQFSSGDAGESWSRCPGIAEEVSAGAGLIASFMPPTNKAQNDPVTIKREKAIMEPVEVVNVPMIDAAAWNYELRRNSDLSRQSVPAVSSTYGFDRSLEVFLKSIYIQLFETELGSKFNKDNALANSSVSPEFCPHCFYPSFKGVKAQPSQCCSFLPNSFNFLP